MDNQAKTRKIRLSSYIFGILCILCGISNFHVISQFPRIYNELIPDEIRYFHLLSKAVYNFPPIIWSIPFILLGILVVYKDLMTDKKYWDTILYIIFVLYVILLAIGCLEPLLCSPQGFGA